MRWFWCSILIFSVFTLEATSAFAQGIGTSLPSKIESTLNRKQIQRFQSEKLGVEALTSEGRRLTGNVYGWVLPNQRFLNTTDRLGYQVEDWNGYQGSRKLSEPEFFRIADQPGAAREAEEYHEGKINKSNLIFGIMGSAISTGWLIGNLLREPSTSEGETVRNVLIGVNIVGIASGLWLALTSKETPEGNWATFGQARQAASNYNESLFDKFTGENTKELSSSTDQEAILPANIEDVNPTVEEALSLPGGAKKVTSSNVESLQTDDVIVSIDGAKLKQEDSLKQVIKRHSPGDTVQLGILREGESKTVSVTLGGRISG